MLNEKAIKEFKELFINHYGIELSDQEATRKANSLIDLYLLVYGRPGYGIEKFTKEPKEPQDGSDWKSDFGINV
jgi:hypothetical protein